MSVAWRTAGKGVGAYAPGPEKASALDVTRLPRGSAMHSDSAVGRPGALRRPAQICRDLPKCLASLSARSQELTHHF
jgi:hypothetical protein